MNYTIKRSDNGEPQLVLNVSISYGSIRHATDFLYLQPQLDDKFDNYPVSKENVQSKLESKNGQTNTSTASSQMPRGLEGHPLASLISKDKEPLPKKLRDVKKERVILIEKSRTMCDNIGTGYIDLQQKKGNYKVYYIRIESEQRILSNSRLEVLGESVLFTLDQLTSDDSQSRNQNSRKKATSNDQQSYEESYSYSNQESIKRNILGSPNSFAESSLDSVVLMKQIQQQYQPNSYSQSVYSSDQTKLLNPGSIYDTESVSYNQQTSNFENNQSSASQYLSEGNSKQSTSNDNQNLVKRYDEIAQIKQSKSKHRRVQNMQFPLEDISNTVMPRRGTNQSALQTSQSGKHHYYSRKIGKGKENLISEYEKAQRNKRNNPNEIGIVYEQKSKSFTNGLAKRKENQMINGNRSKYTSNTGTIGQDNEDIDDDLDVHYVNDIESLVPPRYNPDTRTYFKCSIYSPSNRLYTVNEEVNSTQSDAGEQFSSSQIMSGFRISGHLLNKFSPGYTDRQQQYEENEKIEEEENDDEDPGNLSEGMILPQTPTPKIIQQMKNHFAQETHSGKFSQSHSGTHTRTSSSKAQSLRGSIHIQRPLGSHFSSISSLQQQTVSSQIKNIERIDKQLLNKFLRETFNGVLPQETGVQHIQRDPKASSLNDELNQDVQKFMHPLPGSFVCPGNSGFLKNDQPSTFGHKLSQPNALLSSTESQSSSQKRQKSKDSLSKLSRSSKNKKNNTISIEKTLIKVSQAIGSRKSSNIQNSSSSHSIQDKSERDFSPETYYDEENRKVVIISHDANEGNQIQHCIKWGEDTDPQLVGKAIDEVITKVKRLQTPQKQSRQKDINQELIKLR